MSDKIIYKVKRYAYGAGFDRKTPPAPIKAKTKPQKYGKPAPIKAKTKPSPYGKPAEFYAKKKKG